MHSLLLSSFQLNKTLAKHPDHDAIDGLNAFQVGKLVLGLLPQEPKRERKRIIGLLEGLCKSGNVH
jgi:hypothetical protein